MGKTCYPNLQTCRCGIFIFAFFQVAFLQSQEETLLFHHLTTSQNLTSQNLNNYLFKDSEGFVWISSLDGLNRFDGKQVKQYLPDAKDSLSLADGSIQKGFFEDGQGGLWFSTTQAVHRYDRENDSFKRYYPQSKERKGRLDFHLLHLDTASGQLWLYANDSLFLSPKEQPENRLFLDTVSVFYGYEFQIRYLQKTQQYALAVPQSNGWQVRFYQNGKKTGEFKYQEKRRPGFWSYSFYFENDERLWIATDTGLVALDLSNGRYRIFRDFHGLSVTGIRRIAPAGEGRLVVAAQEKGIFYFDPASLQFTHRLFSDEDGVVKPFLQPINGLYVDPDKNLWVSAPGRGIYFANLHKRKFKAVLQSHPGVPDGMSYVRGMAEDRQGRIWCLTRNGIAVLDENGGPAPGFERFKGKKVPFAGSDPYYITSDFKGRIWVCALAGLFVLPSPDGNFQRVPIPKGSPKKEVAFTAVTPLSNKRILVSSANAGMFEAIENAGKISLRLLTGPKFEKKRYARVFEDRQGHLMFNQLWDSILIYTQNNIQLTPDTSVSMPGMVNAFIEDQLRKTLWIATSQGLFRLTRNVHSWALAQDTIFPFQTINGMLAHNNGDLWASTNLGLVRYRPDSAKYRVYSLADGLQALEFNFSSYLKTSKGKFVFGGVNGINIFDPDEIEDLPVQARPVITSIVVNDAQPFSGNCALTGAKNVARFKKIILPYGQNTLSFRFAALEYSGPATNRFQYMMAGTDNDWVPAGTENFTRYANLREGHYVFKLRASNSDGVWQEKTTNLEIVIRPPWYRSWQFILLLLLSVLGSIYGLYRYRIAQIREKAELNTRVAENKMAALRSQMNPHFIFNSLQTVNGFITRQDLRGAIEYVSQFARLMRVILENSREANIPLEREIELLELYMKIEARRFSKPFTWTITAGKEVDTYNMEIPSMLLQPFVENAIKHGIFHKKEAGHISIAFLKEDSFLKCVVEDNGIGRAKSAELNTQQGRAHKSRGLEIVKERLQIIHASHPGDYELKISDLLDRQQNPTGTRAEIRLPLA